MKRFIIFIAVLVVSGAPIFAHEGNDHVRGVVTQVSPQSMTVQTTDKKTRTLTVTNKTTFQQGGKVAHLERSEGRRSSRGRRSTEIIRGVARSDRNSAHSAGSSPDDGESGARKEARHRVHQLAEADENRRQHLRGDREGRGRNSRDGRRRVGAAHDARDAGDENARDAQRSEIDACGWWQICRERAGDDERPVDGHGERQGERRPKSARRNSRSRRIDAAVSSRSVRASLEDGFNGRGSQRRASSRLCQTRSRRTAAASCPPLPCPASRRAFREPRCRPPLAALSGVAARRRRARGPRSHSQTRAPCGTTALAAGCDGWP